MKTASWVVVERATAKPILETFNRSTANRVNRIMYEVVPILEWLQRVNRAAKVAA